MFYRKCNPCATSCLIHRIKHLKSQIRRVTVFPSVSKLIHSNIYTCIYVCWPDSGLIIKLFNKTTCWVISNSQDRDILKHHVWDWDNGLVILRIHRLVNTNIFIRGCFRFNCATSPPPPHTQKKYVAASIPSASEWDLLWK